MARERRGAPRYIVDGLNITVDGAVYTILDIAATSVRVLRQPGVEPASVCVRLRLWNDPDQPRVDFGCAGFLIRETPSDLVYGFQAPDIEWPWLLPAFDTFKDHRLAVLED